jgi:hypothetical protein
LSDITINDVKAEVQRIQTGIAAGSVTDDLVKLYSWDPDTSTGSYSTVNKSAGATWSKISATYGSYNDEPGFGWGSRWWLPDTTNHANSGVGFAASLTRTGGTGNVIANVDHVRMTVTYTELAGATRRRMSVLFFEPWLDLLHRLRCPLQPEQWAPGLLVMAEVLHWARLDNPPLPLIRRIRDAFTQDDVRVGALVLR